MYTRGTKLHDGLIDIYGEMITRFQSRMQAGEHVPDCLAKTLIETREEEKLDWEDLCMLAAVFTLGGVHSVCFLHRLTYVNLLTLWFSFVDGWIDPMVHGFDAVRAGGPSSCARGTGQGCWKG